MPLITQALTTLSNARLYLTLYSTANVTSDESLTADTGNETFTFANTDIMPNTFGSFYHGVVTAGDTITTNNATVDYQLAQITFSAAMTGGVTVSSYSYFDWDYSKDKLLENYINQASDYVSKYCNRNFIADTYSEYYKGSGRQKLVVNQYPINYITSISDDSASLTAGTDYVTSDSTYLDKGIIFNNTGWVWRGYLTGLVGELTGVVSSINVVYSAGYTLEPETTRTLPYDLEFIVVEMVAEAYKIQQESRNGIRQIMQGKLLYIFKDAAESYKDTLSIYKKAVF